MDKNEIIAQLERLEHLRFQNVISESVYQQERAVLKKQT